MHQETLLVTKVLKNSDNPLPKRENLVGFYKKILSHFFPHSFNMSVFDKWIIFEWFTQGVCENTVKMSAWGKAKNMSLAMISLWTFEPFSARVTYKIMELHFMLFFTSFPYLINLHSVSESVQVFDFQL